MFTLRPILLTAVLLLLPHAVHAERPAEVTYQDIVVGTGDTVKRHAFAVMHFHGWVYDENAPEFKGHHFADSRQRGETVTWVYGLKRAVPGLEKGMVGMRVGGRRLITVPPNQGYDGRKHQAPEGVPSNATLLFEVELLSVVPQGAPRAQ